MFSGHSLYSQNGPLSPPLINYKNMAGLSYKQTSETNTTLQWIDDNQRVRAVATEFTAGIEEGTFKAIGYGSELMCLYTPEPLVFLSNLNRRFRF